MMGNHRATSCQSLMPIDCLLLTTEKIPLQKRETWLSPPQFSDQFGLINNGTTDSDHMLLEEMKSDVHGIAYL